MASEHSTHQGIAAERYKELQREDEAEIGAIHSTVEAGELTSAGNLWREGSANLSQLQ